MSVKHIGYGIKIKLTTSLRILCALSMHNVPNVHLCKKQHSNRVLPYGAKGSVIIPYLVHLGKRPHSSVPGRNLIWRILNVIQRIWRKAFSATLVHKTCITVVLLCQLLIHKAFDINTMLSALNLQTTAAFVQTSI